MPDLDDKVAPDDVACLLALRGALVRRAPRPTVSAASASRLQALGYISSSGHFELTEAGLAFLEQYFTFCEATGCDGVLRRWTFLSPEHSACDPGDPDVEPNLAGGYYIKCPKCGSLNLLEGADHPMRLGDYRIKSVIPAV